MWFLLSVMFFFKCINDCSFFNTIPQKAKNLRKILQINSYTYTGESIVLVTKGAIPTITVSKWNRGTFFTEPASNFNGEFSSGKK